MQMGNFLSTHLYAELSFNMSFKLSVPARHTVSLSHQMGLFSASANIESLSLIAEVAKCQERCL